jgi:hypothetical protein
VDREKHTDRINVLEILVFLLFILILALIIVSPLRVHTDNAVHILQAKSILEGSLPYIDFFSVNFPLIIYEHIPAVVVANLLHANVIPVLQLMLFGTVVWSMLISRHLLMRHLESGKQLAALLGLALALLTLYFLTKNMFGAKSQIVVLLYVPFLLLRWLRVNGHSFDPRLALFIGGVAALGINIKPHYYAIFLGVEALWAFEKRTLRHLLSPEMVGFGVVTLLYAICFLVTPAEIRQTLWSYLLAIRQGYRLRTTHNYSLLQFIGRYMLIVVIALIPFALHRKERVTDDLSRALGLIALVGLAIYIWHWRDLSSQRAIMFFACMFILTIELSQFGLADAPRSTIWQHPAVTVFFHTLAAMCFFVFFITFAGILAVVSWEQDPLSDFFSTATEPSDRIMLVTTRLSKHKAALEAERQLTPYINARLVTYMLLTLEGDSFTDTYSPDYQLPPTVDHYLSKLGQNIEEFHPELIVIEDSENISQIEGFSLWDFMDNRGLSDQHIYDQYVSIESPAGWRAFRYVGEPPSLMEIPIYFNGEFSLRAWNVPGGQPLHPCEAATFQTWWQAEDMNAQGNLYHMSAVIAREGQGIVKVDGPIGDSPTSNWKNGYLYLDERVMDIPCDLPTGEYDLLATVYDVNHEDVTLGVTYPDGTPIGEYFYVTPLRIAE